MSDLLIWQYRGKPKARQTVGLLLSETADVFKSVIELGNSLNINIATGYSLDLIGRHVGISRVLTTYIHKNYFGFDFDESALGFNAGEWYQYGDSLKDSVVLNDDDYRFLIKAKILKNYQRADIGNLVESIRFLFGERANVIDNYDMTITGIIPFNNLSQFKVYVIKNMDILQRPVGVKYKFFQTSSHPFGWYEDSTAFGFNSGIWSDFI